MAAESSSKPKKKTLLWIIIFALSALEGLVVLWPYIATPSEAKNSLILGLSLQRLTTIGGIGLVILAFLALAFLFWKKPTMAQAFAAKVSQENIHKVLSPLFLALVFIGGLAYFLPVDRWTNEGSAYEHFRPVILWLTLVFIQFLLAFICTWNQFGAGLLVGQWKAEKRLLQSAAISLGIFLLVWIFIDVTGIGITPDDRYWNEAGVPVIGFQILLALTISLAAGAIFFMAQGQSGGESRRSFLSGWKLDLLISVALWVAAALLWTQTPMSRSYFAPGPYPPNNVYYPYSDAAVYDLGAQYTLIGQGFNNNAYSDKPFYMFVIILLRLVAGQEYLPVVQLQAVFLALFPVLLYFIGKTIHSRTAGLLAGLFLVLQQTNAISATLKIQVSHSRLLMSEFPTAFGIALLCLVLVRWFKHPRFSPVSPLLAGGILGILILIRTNPLILVPFVVLWIVIIFNRRWKTWLASSALLAMGILLVIGPWFFLEKTPDGKTFIQAKVSAVLETRYDEARSDAVDVLPPPVAASTASPALTATPILSTPTATPISLPPTPTALAALPTSAPGTTQPPANNTLSRVVKALQFTPEHFLHNFIMAVLPLPGSLNYDSFSYLHLDLEAPYWDTSWTGQLTLENGILLVLNLALLAIGLGAAWNFSGWTGLVPLMMLVGYYLSNGLGRTSGSRYLVPADWVILFYFALGMIQVCLWAAVLLGFRCEVAGISAGAAKQSTKKINPFLSASIIAVGMILLGFSMVVIGKFFPLRYPDQTPAQLQQAVLARGALQKMGISQQDVDRLLSSYGGVILRGRALYPRYYAAGRGEPPSKMTPSFGVQGYPRLIIELVGPTTRWVSLPLTAPMEYFPNGADITVIGCQDSYDIKAQALIIEGSTDTVYLRTPPAEWKCPQALPVCDNQNVCR